MNTTRSEQLTTLLTIALIFYGSDAMAEVSSGNILNNVTEQFRAQASNWGGIITGYATWLFWTLGTISLVWTGGALMFKKADIGEFFAEFIRFILFFGFFLWLLRNAAGIGSAIINSMMIIGADASQTGVSNPSAIMDIGFNIFYKVMEQSSIWSMADSIIGAILAGIVLICIALIAANMTIMLCSAWILLYGGIFFLGFGGSRWTSDIAINYYKSLLSVAVSLMAMILMIGIAQSIITNYYNQMSAGIRVTEITTIMVVAVILLLLVHRVPGMIAGILTGSSIGNSGIGSYSAGTAMGVASVATVAAGTAISSAIRHISGGGQAVQDLMQNTQQSMPTGESSSNNAPASGGLAEAMGGSKSTASEMGQSFVNALKQSAGKVKDKASEALSDNFSGKTMETQSAMMGKGSETMPNSIGAANTTEDEISDFVHKNE